MISESEYSHEAFEHVLPFREIFTSIFFVSAGMLLDIGYLWEHLVLVLAVLLAVLVFKLFILLGRLYWECRFAQLGLQDLVCVRWVNLPLYSTQQVAASSC